MDALDATGIFYIERHEAYGTRRVPGWLNLNRGSLIRAFFTWLAARASPAEGIQMGLANWLVVIVRGLHLRDAPANMSLWHPRKALVQGTALVSVRGTARFIPSTLDTIGTTRGTSACAPFPRSRLLQTDRFRITDTDWFLLPSTIVQAIVGDDVDSETVANVRPCDSLALKFAK